MSEVNKQSFPVSKEKWRESLTFDLAQRWQDKIDSAADYELKVDYSVQALNDLSITFPYVGYEVYICGRGLHAVADRYSQKKFLDDNWDPSTTSYGVHQGFVALPQGGKRIEIAQKVLIEHIAYMVGGKSKELNIYTYHDLESKMLVADEIDEIYEGDQDVPVAQKLKAAYRSSQQLKVLLATNEFLELNQEGQLQQLDLLVAQAEEETGLRDMSLVIDGLFCYSTGIKEGYHLITGIDISKQVISGTCLGVEAIENLLLQYMTLAKDSHGICLVIDPDEETRLKLGLKGQQLLYVPVIQEMAVGSK